MILIISSIHDKSTDKVINWLKKNSVSFTRLNREDTVQKINIHVNDDIIDIKIVFVNTYARKYSFNLSEVTIFWYRRGDISIINTEIPNDIFTFFVNTQLKDDWDTVKSFFYYLLEDKYSLGSYKKEVSNNKLIDLFNAKRVGLRIPNTIVTSSKRIVESYFIKNETIITKDIRYPIDIVTENHIIQGGKTSKVNSKNIDILAPNFAPSLVQAEVKKHIEIRTFFIKNRFFSMAIFSQLDDKTKLDFRNYNKQKPNRYVPYSLPQIVEEKLKHFMNISMLDTGSIDMILTENMKYVFLEVNPSGQFDFVSFHCNYFLEKEIAEHLSNPTEYE